MTGLAAGATSCDTDEERDPDSRPDADAASPAPSTRESRDVHGFVRDVNGTPVPGARVGVLGSRHRARADRRGRFRLRVPPGEHTLTARHPAYTRQSVPTRVRAGRPTRLDFSLAIADPARVPLRNSAARVIMWTSCDDLAKLGATSLNDWRRRGVDGFVCQAGRLPGLGGKYRFSAGEKTLGQSRPYALQHRLRRSEAVRRAKQGRLDLYLGFYASSSANDRTPFVDWFDDRLWSRTVIPSVRNLAGAARSMGFEGLAIDQELYTESGSYEGGATWRWNYPGNRRSQVEVRDKVTQRGRQLMAAMTGAFPGLELLAYDTELPGSWSERVQAKANDSPNAFASSVLVDLWDGLSSVHGYRAIRWLDATFYKAPDLPGATWDTALQYNANMIYSLLSRRFSDWAYASARLHISPFSWINAGPSSSTFDDARPVAHVAEQLEAFSKWGTGGTFGNYAYGGLDRFDYGPYEDAMNTASASTTADRSPPHLELTDPTNSAPGGRLDLKGFAQDDLAIRAVRWQDERGGEGVAKLTWEASGNEREGWRWRMRWAIDDLRLRRGENRITVIAEDIKGLATSRVIRVRR